MKVETLEAYNLAPDVLRVWCETVGTELLPVQERAVKEFGLFHAGNLIVFSPTSSGKTFVGEMAAVKAARDKLKVLYLVPQKALAEEKFQEFRRRYGGSGIKVVVSSRDRREFDDEIQRRDFQIAVVVFEKAQSLLVARPQLMKNVGLVVVDELQLITDETRGPSLELLLTKLRMSKPGPRIVGLSAVLGRAQALADWLDARLLIDTERPVELRKGVLCHGDFRYREHNSGAEGTEPFRDCGSEQRHDLILSAVEDLVARGEQVLAFLPDRASTVSFARLLADRARLPALEAAIDELRENEETHAREALLEVLSSSVAFHNSDLSLEEREVVERHFRSGGIKALFSTSTLAMGLNMPVKNVVLDGKRWQYLRRYGRWSLEDITKSEYENMSGRAGRLAFTNDFGRSVLVTSSKFEADVWLRHYVEADFEDVVPTLKDAPLEDQVVNLLASGLCDSRSSLFDLLMSSFTGFVYWSQALSRDEFSASLDGAIRWCLDGGLIREHEEKGLKVTDLGRACATKGIDVRTGVALSFWAKDARAAALSEIEVLTAVSLTPAGDDVYVNMSNRERYRADYRAQILQRAASSGVDDRPIFRQFAEDEWAAEYETAKSLKKALLLADWIEEVRTKDLERRYHVWAGSLRRIGEEHAWLVEALGAVAKACSWSDARCRELEVLSDRLLYGVREDALRIARLRVRGLGRALLRRLVQAGFKSEESMREAGEETVKEALNHRGAFERLWTRLTQADEPPSPSRYPEAVPELASIAAEPAVKYRRAPALVIDLGERTVVYRGQNIPTRPPNNLQRQPLLALAVLAQSPGTTVSATDLAARMFDLGGLRKKPLTPDPRDLRYKMLRPIKKAVDGAVAIEELDRLIESVPGVGLRLNIESADARVVVPKPV